MENNRGLKVLDFGGSLGSTYYQCREILKNIKPLEWSIVEQENYVAAGNKFFADDTITFYNSLSDAYLHSNPNVLLMGSVLQYIERPYCLLDEVLNFKWNYVIIDRTPFIKTGTNDIITIQYVPESIYPAQFPARLFHKENLITKFSKDYELIAEWKSSDCLKTNVGEVDFRGFLFKKSILTCQ